MTLIVKVSNMAGDRLEHTAAEMFALASKLGFPVECEFNGIKLFMPVDGSPEALIKDFHIECRRERTYRGYASGRVK